MMHEDEWMAARWPTIGTLNMTDGFSATATSIRQPA
jgi:hypothetical protein